MARILTNIFPQKSKNQRLLTWEKIQEKNRSQWSDDNFKGSCKRAPRISLSSHLVTSHGQEPGPSRVSYWVHRQRQRPETIDKQKDAKADQKPDSRSMTREASRSFTLKPPDQSPSRHHMQTTGWCLALLITRTHSFLNLGMRHVFGNPVSTLILKAGLVSYPSIRIKPSSSQEVWLLAENLLSLLFHSSKLQKWVHFASYLNFHTCESFCFLEEVSVKGKV